MELSRIGNEAIKKELNCNCSCRAHDIYVRILSKESTHDRVVASRIYDIGSAEIHRKGGGVDDSI